MSIDISTKVSQAEWEAFQLQVKPEALFQSWLWGDVLTRQGVKIWRLVVRRNGALIGIILAAKIAAKRGTFIHIRHGPVVQNQEKIVWKDIFQYLVRLARTEKAWFFRISPLFDNSAGNRKFFLALGLRPAPIHAMDAELCWILDLDTSDDVLLAGMRKTTRYEIHRAQKLGVEIKTSDDPNDLRYFHRLYRATSRRHGFTAHTGIDAEFEVFVKNHKGLLFLGSYIGEVKAAAIVLFFGNQAIYRHSASIPTHVGVNHRIQWEAIKEAKKRGMNVYNFWGIAPENNPNHPWRGITLFKKGFGGRQIEYIHAHDLPVSPFYIIPKIIESIRKSMRHY